MDDIEVIFIADCEWDVEPVSTSVPQTSTDVEVECAMPHEKRAVQGCFCAKCSRFRSR